jgi:hypothetical protein
MTINISASPAKFYKTSEGGVEINMSSAGAVINMELDTAGVVSQEFIDARPEKPTLKLRSVEWCDPEDGTLYHGVILATEFWKATG